MRKRQVTQYLIHPHCFKSLSIQYKGTYCVSFSLHQITQKNTKTQAFPFLIPSHSTPHVKENASVHMHQPFSFQTQKFSIFYEEETCKLGAGVVFRMEYDCTKRYNTFLVVSLLKKIVAKRPQQGKYCVRNTVQTNIYETLDTQTIQIVNLEGLYYDRIVFKASEFYSCIQFCIASFGYGLRHFADKNQLSNLLQEKHLKIIRSFQENIYEGEAISTAQKGLIKSILPTNQLGSALEKKQLKIIAKDCKNTLMQQYGELVSLVKQYNTKAKQLEQLYKIVISQRPTLKQATFQNLQGILANKASLDQLILHYETQDMQQLLSSVREDQQIIRINIRKLRIQCHRLLTFQSDSSFTQEIQKQVKKRQQIQQRGMVRYSQDILSQNFDKDKVRQQGIATCIEKMNFCNQQILTAPLILLQGFNLSSSSKLQKTLLYTKMSLTVFIHGYQGNSFDFQKSKNYIKNYCKHTQILIIQSITDDMTQSIQSLGTTAAHQINNYIQNSYLTFTSINFIAFSLGGLIARAAFKHMKKYHKIFNVFVTLSSPHLGISQNQNSLVNIGVWFLIRVDKVKNLSEMNFQSVKIQDSVLGKMTSQDSLSLFKRVVLVCSRNDQFVPFYSTVLDQSGCSQEISRLCSQLLGQIKQLHRVEVAFDLKHAGTLDKLTGRKGHIQFLDNDFFLQYFYRIMAPLL